MLITTNGIVIRERSVGENDKFIDVLTGDLGVIELSVRGVKKITGKNSSAAQLFAYSKLCLDKRGERYYLNSSEPIHIFYDIRMDMEKFALASYFCEVVLTTVTSGQTANSVTRLFLNTLNFLTDEKYSDTLIKSIFELRLMSEIGLMPDIAMCNECCTYLTEKMYFKIRIGKLFCDKCYNRAGDAVELSESLLHTIRYICLSDFEKLWSFKVSDEVEKQLSYITESYLISHLDRNFRTLGFYKDLKQ